MNMLRTNSTEKAHQQRSEDLFTHLQQPESIIIQQFPAAVTSPLTPVRPAHIREDLVELMMIQNAQMHQVIMNNMNMSVLNSFNYTHIPEMSRITTALEEEPDVYHHYYPPVSCLCYPGGVSLPQPLIQTPPPHLQNMQNPSEPVQPVHTEYRHRKAVAPPPPPSATQTVGADVPPAPEFYAAERGQ